VGNAVINDKETLWYIVTCLQVSQSKVALQQTQTRLLHDVLERKNLQQNWELVLFQNKPLFEEDDGVDSNKKLVHDKINDATS